MLEDLLAGNKAWSEKRRAEEPEYSTRLAALQAHEFVWIGCSDSGVPAMLNSLLCIDEVLNRVASHTTNSARAGCLPVAVGRMVLPADAERQPAGAHAAVQPFRGS